MLFLLVMLSLYVLVGAASVQLREMGMLSCQLLAGMSVCSMVRVSPPSYMASIFTFTPGS